MSVKEELERLEMLRLREKELHEKEMVTLQQRHESELLLAKGSFQE